MRKLINIINANYLIILFGFFDFFEQRLLICAFVNSCTVFGVFESTILDGLQYVTFDFIDALLKKTGKIGDYDQKI